MFFDAARPETINSIALACRNNDVKMLKAKISEGCGRDGLRHKDNRGWEPIHEACHAKALYCLRILLEQDCVDINALSWAGFTPLNVAVSQDNSVQVAKILVEEGADVNICEDMGLSPLHQATTRRDRDLVDILLKNRANVNKKSVWSTTPLHTLLNDASSQDEEIVIEILKLLISNGAELDIGDENELTSLIIAAQKGFLEVCKILLENCIRLLNMQAEDGANALMLACQEGHSDIVKLLLEVSDKNPEHALDMNKKTIDGAMAVHFTVTSKGHGTELLEILLKRTRPQEIVDAKTFTIFQLAMIYENWECVITLAKYLQPLAFHIDISQQQFKYEVPENYSLWSKYTLLNPLAFLLINQIRRDIIPSNFIKPLVQSLISCLFDYKENSLPPVLAFALLKPNYDDDLFLLEYSQQKFQERSEMIRIIAANKKENYGKYLVQILMLGHPADIYLLFREGFINASDLSDRNKLKCVLTNIPRVQEETRNVFDNKALALKHLFLLELFGLTRLEPGFMLDLSSKYNISSKELYTYLRIHNSMSRGMKSLQAIARSKLHLTMPGGINSENVNELPLPAQLRDFMLFEDKIDDLLKSLQTIQKYWVYGE